MTISPDNPTGKCGLCGHDPSCGYAVVSDARGDTFLCHADDHSCYHAWTVWDTRPTDVLGIARVGKVEVL